MLAGPISYLLASDAFDAALGDILRESIPETLPGRERALTQVDEITAVLAQRKASYRKRRPGIVNLISAIEMEHFLQNGLVGRPGLPDKIRRERRALARAEAEHFVALIENEPIGVQIGIVADTLPHASFQILRQPDRQILVLSPFRLGEQPNIRVGVAMITSAPRGAGAAREDGPGALGARAEGIAGGGADARPAGTDRSAATAVTRARYGFRFDASRAEPG